MSNLIHKFLADKERGRNILASIAAIGTVLLAISIAITS